MPIQTHGTTHKPTSARKASAFGCLLIELWWWVADWMTYWWCARWTCTWSKSSRGATMSSSFGWPRRSHSSSRTTSPPSGPSLKMKATALTPLVVCWSSCGGGLPIGLQFWVVGFFLDGFGNSGGGFGLWSLCWHLALEKEKDTKRKRE